MGASTRPTQQRHQVEVTLLSSLMALFFLQAEAALAAPQKAYFTSQEQPASVLSGTLPVATAFSLVQPGEEAIELSARFTQDSKNCSDAVDWQIKNANGEALFEGTAAVASMKLKPGAYEVIGHYGNVDIDEAINLQPQTRLAVNFVLNAGGLRVLPRLPEAFAPNRASNANIYALNGSSAGRLVAPDVKPGQMLKLAAGTYRIETRYETGNVSAVTDVEVKAGLLRAVDIAHHAGMAKLSLDRRQEAQWLVMENGGSVLPLPSGKETTAYLKPGNYVAEAHLGGKVLQQAFTITEGQVSTVVLTTP
jgi:hypothetical protein